jgi:hypothetical protein
MFLELSRERIGVVIKYKPFGLRVDIIRRKWENVIL